MCNIFLISVVKSHTKFIAPHLKHNKRINLDADALHNIKDKSTGNILILHSNKFSSSFVRFTSIELLLTSDICQSSKIELELVT